MALALHISVHFFVRELDTARERFSLASSLQRRIYDAAANASGVCRMLYFAEDDRVTSFNAVYVSKWKTQATPIIHFCTELSPPTEITVSMLARCTNRLQGLRIKKKRKEKDAGELGPKGPSHLEFRDDLARFVIGGDSSKRISQ